jgi:hypothetical protein
MGLVKFNVIEYGNDIQIKKTFRDSYIKILIEDLNEY